jgi:hypothetical protein
MKKISLKLNLMYVVLGSVWAHNSYAREAPGVGVGAFMCQHPYLSATAGMAILYGAGHYFSGPSTRHVDGEKIALPITYSQEFCAHFDEVFTRLSGKKEGEKFFIINAAVELRTKRPEEKCKILYFADDQGKRHVIAKLLEDGLERRYNVQFLNEKEVNALLKHVRLYVSDNPEEAHWGALRLKQILRLPQEEVLTSPAVLQKFSWFCDQDKELQSLLL